jgi:hypothetical protein
VFHAAPSSAQRSPRRRRNLGFGATRLVVAPHLRHVQVHTDRHVLRAHRHGEAYGNLAVGDFAQRTALLPLNPRGVAPLFDEAHIIDNPHVECFLDEQRVERGACSTRTAWSSQRELLRKWQSLW